MTQPENTPALNEAVSNPAPEEVATWRHHHAIFVLAVISRYHFNYYVDRKVHPAEIGSGIDGWKSDDHKRAIEEGRRQLDGQLAQLQFVTSRASALLPVGIAMALYFLTPLNNIGDLDQPWRTIATLLLALGAAFAIWGTLVMGAIVGGRSNLGLSDSILLSREPAGLDEFLARDYATLVPIGHDTHAARLTHLGTGVAWIVFGAVVGALGVATAELSADTRPEPALCSRYVRTMDELMEWNPAMDLDAEFHAGGLLGEFEGCDSPSIVLERLTD